MLVSLALTLLPAAALPQQDPVTIQPDAVLGDDGKLHEGWVVTVQDGKITSVGEGGEGALRVPGVLSAGMVDANSSWGAAGRLSEESRRLTPGLLALDGVDPDADAFAELLARGVTAVHVTPAASNVIGGRGALLTTAGAERTLADSTLLVGSLIANEVFDQRFGPTSLVGALELLGQGLPALPEADRAGPMWLTVDSAEAVRGARAAAEASGTALGYVAIGDLGSYGGELAGGLIVVPAATPSSARAVESWKRMHAAGTRFALGSRFGSSSWSALRTSAMALSRATGDPAAAWAAVTKNPAEALGMGTTLGVLQAGARADLVLWTAHPLDATATVQAVVIGGETVWRPTPKEN